MLGIDLDNFLRGKILPLTLFVNVYGQMLLVKFKIKRISVYSLICGFKVTAKWKMAKDFH